MGDEPHQQDASGTPDLSGVEPFRIFLSYRREDASGHAGRLFDFLSAGGVGGESGFRKDQIFMDIDTIAPGVDFRDVIAQAVGSCDVFIAVIGKQWVSVVDEKGRRRLDNAKDFVRLEVEAALEREIPVVPALVQGAEIPSVEELPETFRELPDRNAVELSDTRWPHDVGKLVAWLKTEEEKKTRRLQAEHDQAAATHEGVTDDVVEGEPDEPRDRDGKESGRRFGRKHVILSAALVTLAVAGIAGAMALVSGSGSEDSPPTDAAPTQEPLLTPGDEDGDGLPDAEDPFALDPENGSELPVELTFTDAVAGTIEGSGFTGLMTDPDEESAYYDLFDADNVIVGDGAFTIRSVGQGAAAEEKNEQLNGFQFGIRVPDESFTAHARLIEPFAGRAPPRGEEVIGLFVGTGDQDNFVRLGVGGPKSRGVKFRVEVDGETEFGPDYEPLVLPGSEAVDLYLTTDPAAETVRAEVRKTENGEMGQVATFSGMIPAGWIDRGKALAVGIVSSRGDAPRFAATWGLVEVFEGNPVDGRR